MSYEDAIIQQLRYFAFASIVIAQVCDYAMYRDAQIGKRICFLVFLIAAIAFYNDIVDAGNIMFADVQEAARDNVLKTLVDIKAKTTTGASESSWLDWGSWKTALQMLLWEGCWAISNLICLISEQVRVFFVTLFKICAPVVLGLGAWRLFRSNLISFVNATIWLCMWSVGYAIADVVVVKVMLLVFGKALASAGGNVANAISAGTAIGGALASALAVAGVIVVVALVVFYILTPLMLYAVIAGSNPAQAALGAVQSAFTGGIAGGQIATAAQQAYKQHKSNSSGNGGSSSNPGSGNGASTASPPVAAATADSPSKESHSNISANISRQIIKQKQG